MPRRDNGFRRDGALSLNAHQLGGASLYLGLVLGFYLLQAPAIEDATARLACEIAFACVAAVVCGAFFRAAAIDPADDTHALATKPGDVMRCDLCAHAVSRGSKHCRSCDKCVAHFDHHCRWLNNCVGSKNYAPFFLLLCSTLTLTVAQLCAGAYLTHWAVTEKDEADALLRSSRYPTKINRNHFLAALGVYLAAGALLCYVVADLFFFHLLLMKRGITTYDYVLGARAARAAADIVVRGEVTKAGGSPRGSSKAVFTDESLSAIGHFQGTGLDVHVRGFVAPRSGLAPRHVRPRTRVVPERVFASEKVRFRASPRGLDGEGVREQGVQARGLEEDVRDVPGPGRGHGRDRRGGDMPGRVRHGTKRRAPGREGGERGQDRG